MKRFVILLFGNIFLAGMMSACTAASPSSRPIAIGNNITADSALFQVNQEEPEAEKQGEAVKAALRMVSALQEINRQEQYEELLETERSVVELDILESQIQQ